MELLIGILFGAFVTHNLEAENAFKCKFENNTQACIELEKEKK